MAIAVVYTLTAKPLYEAKATLEIGHQIIKTKDGQISVRYFDQSERIKQYIDTKYDTAGKYRKKGSKASIKKVDIPRKANQFVTIDSYGLDNKLAINKLKEAINDILYQHDLHFDAIVNDTKDKISEKERAIKYDNNVLLPNMKQKLLILKTTELKKINEKIRFLKNVTISSLKQKISKSESEINKMTEALKNIQKTIRSIGQKYPSLAAGETMQIANLQNDIDRLNMRILDLQLQIKQINSLEIPNLLAQKEKLLKETIPSSEGNIKKLSNITITSIKAKITSLKMSIVQPYLVKTHIVGKIYAHDYPVKPKKKLIVAVALITGLMLGLFLAFFLEFIGKEKD